MILLFEAFDAFWMDRVVTPLMKDSPTAKQAEPYDLQQAEEEQRRKARIVDRICGAKGRYYFYDRPHHQAWKCKR